MTSQTRGPLTRGPLPARVYWRRRLAMLGVAVLLVVGIARLLGSGSDGSSDDGAASLADAPVSSSTTSTTPSASPSTTPKPGKKGNRASETPLAPTTTAPPPPPPPAEPDGPCVDSDVAVTPEVGEAIAGPRYGVTVTLQLRTIVAEACTWKVSPSTLSVKITSGDDDIWSSRECPRAIAAQPVTVRSAESTTVSFTWNARRSDEDCSKLTEYAMPGWYHVTAAALGGEPSQVQFEMLAPQPAVVTQTADPQQDKGKKGGKRTP
jgi:hypothetical protein